MFTGLLRGFRMPISSFVYSAIKVIFRRKSEIIPFEFKRLTRKELFHFCIF